MSKVIHVGATGRKKATLPLDFVTETAAILARRGGGKTYTGKVLAEGLLKFGHQVVVLDPLNAWWGLRSSADGRSAGYPIVIFGGSRGDLPLDKDMGEGIADLVAENPHFSCVLSLRHLSKGKQKHFVTAFASRLFERKGDEKLATAVHIFMDEADIFCPQQVLAREAEMVGAVDDLVRRGRQAGIGFTMITQRSAALNKNVLSQAELLIAGQITGAHDKKAILDWIKDNADVRKQKEFMASLATLQIGQFWFWSPRWLGMLAQVDIRKSNTFDSSATPKPGKRRRVPKRVRAVDLKKIKKTLESAIETAERTDPKVLRHRIAELERELKKKGKAAPASVIVAAPTPVPVVQGVPKAEVTRLIGEAIAERDGVWRKAVDEEIVRFSKGVRIPEFTPVRIPAFKSKAIRVPRASKVPARVERSPGRSTTTHSAPSIIPVSAGAEMPKCEKALLGVLFSRDRAVSSRLVALQSGYSIKSSSFANSLSSLRAKGWIIGGGNALSITSAGQAAFLVAGGEAVDVIDPSFWSSKLRKCERAIFELLLKHRRPMTAEEISDETNYSIRSSSFANALSKLRGLQLIEGERGASISLREELFA